MEAAWAKRGIEPDIDGSPWCVGAALHDEFDAGWLSARDYYEQRHVERMAPAIEAAADFKQRERVLRHVLQLTTEALESTTESLMMAIDLHAEEREAIRADIARAQAALADTEAQA